MASCKNDFFCTLRHLVYCIPFNLKDNFWGLEYLFWWPKIKPWEPAGPKIWIKRCCDNSSYFSALYSTQLSYRLTINFTCPVGQVLYEFQSSEAKTYSSQRAEEWNFFALITTKVVANSLKNIKSSLHFN